MSLAPPTVQQLSDFTGRASNTFTNYALEALSQATLLFYFATGLSEYPTGHEEALLAKYGVLDMADKLYSSQPYRESLSSPFQSETIGSYSYSKLVHTAKKGDATGVMWFDLAVNKLRGDGSAISSHGSIEGMENDGLAVTDSGRARIIGASGTRVPRYGAWEIDTEEVIHHHPIL